MRAPGRRPQAGSTLIISLIMLVLLTLAALSSIGSGTINLRIANNMQTRDEGLAAAQREIEDFISSPANFTPVPAGRTRTVSVNGHASGNYTVTVGTPACKRSALQKPARTLECINGEKAGVYCRDTLWEVTATATPAAGGSSQSVTQGVTIAFAPDKVPATCK